MGRVYCDHIYDPLGDWSSIMEIIAIILVQIVALSIVGIRLDRAGRL